MCGIGEIFRGNVRFYWKIPEFSKRLRMLPLDYINSPTFQYEGDSWQLTVEVKDKYNTKPCKYVSLYISRKHDCHTESVAVSLRFCTSDGKEVEACNVIANFGKGQFYWGPATLLLNMDAILAPEDMMTVFCSLKKDLVEEEESKSEESSEEKESESEESSDEEEELKALKAECCSSLYEDMKKMFYDQIGWDVCLMVSGYTIPAHISVLSCRSPVFYGMLKDHPESLKLEDCETDVFITFLEFLYLGKIDHPSATNAIKLYRLAHRYEVSLLKKLCLDVLHRCLSLDTVYDVLRLANEFCVTTLLEEATEFLMKNHSEILDRKEWIQFLEEIDHPSVTNAIKLYRLAHRYEVSLLKDLCLVVLHRCLSLDTVCDVLRLANEFCVTTLLEEATEFLMKNHSEILDRKEWIQFLEEDPLLANEFMKQIISFIRRKKTQRD